MLDYFGDFFFGDIVCFEAVEDFLHPILNNVIFNSFIKLEFFIDLHFGGRVDEKLGIDCHIYIHGFSFYS